MKHKDLLNLVDKAFEQQVPDINRPKKYLLIDGLNLFFRNFAVINSVNSRGAHIGGLGGFFRSLGSMIRKTQPTDVYVIFDGIGSSNNRKNIIPEYKSGRNVQRITNWDVFSNLDEENTSKVDQIVRVIQYLKTLPVKTTSIDKVEADDIIAYLSKTLPKTPDERVFIVSSDQDFLQLINENVIVYRPMEKKFYNESDLKDKYKVNPYNFLVRKTLLGDNSDKIKGIKGLGEGKIIKLFPDLAKRKVTLDEIYDISIFKMKDHKIYALIVQNIEELRRGYKVMDLENMMMDDEDKEGIDKLVASKDLSYAPEEFMSYYNQDQLGGIIRNTEFWLSELFQPLTKY